MKMDDPGLPEAAKAALRVFEILADSPRASEYEQAVYIAACKCLAVTFGAALAVVEYEEGER